MSQSAVVTMIAHVPDESSLEIAYYYPEPLWNAGEEGRIKTLLLFFDQLALLVPSNMQGRILASSPHLAAEMFERGMLRILDPESFIDTEAMARVNDFVVELIAAGAFTRIDKSQPFEAISAARMGFHLDKQAFGFVFEELAQRGLARGEIDGSPVNLERSVRFAYLFALGQTSRHSGSRFGLNLHPTLGQFQDTPYYDVGMYEKGFIDFLNLQEMPTQSRSTVIARDLDVLGIDLGPVPLDELASYRFANRDLYRMYADNVRDTSLKLTLLDGQQRTDLLESRAVELEDAASELRSRIRSAWSTPKAAGGLALAVAGCAWAAVSANPVGAALAALGVGLRLLPDRESASAYSYILGSKTL